MDTFQDSQWSWEVSTNWTALYLDIDLIPNDKMGYVTCWLWGILSGAQSRKRNLQKPVYFWVAELKRPIWSTCCRQAAGKKPQSAQKNDYSVTLLAQSQIWETQQKCRRFVESSERGPLPRGQSLPGVFGVLIMFLKVEQPYRNSYSFLVYWLLI